MGKGSSAFKSIFQCRRGIAAVAQNDVKCRAKLLQMLGVDLYNKFCNVVGDDASVNALTFDEVVTQVDNLVNPAPLEIAERFLFLNRRQLSGELSAEFMLALC